MSCSERPGQGGGEAGEERERRERNGGNDSAVMDWGPLRPPNSKASRKSCQSALSLSQSVQVARVQGTRSDTAQKTHNSNTGGSWGRVSEGEHVCVCVFDLRKTKSTDCAATDLTNHLVSFSVVLLKCVYTHDCCFFSFFSTMGGIECPLQARDLHLPANLISTNVHTHTHTHTQINPQIQADNLREYSEINGNGI